MDRPIPNYWLTLPEPRLRTHLYDKLKFPPALAASLIARVGAMREERRAKAIQRTKCFALWDDFLKAPRAELGNVRTMKSQLKREGGENTPRWDALCAYEVVLVMLIERFKEHQKVDVVTPKQLPAWLKENGKREPQRDGLHWVDYVPSHIKEKVERMFNALPPSKRGKTKAPFERIMPLRQFKTAKVKLVKELNTAQEMAEQDLFVAREPEDVERAETRLMEIARAQYVLDNHKRSAPLPATWWELL